MASHSGQHCVTEVTVLPQHFDTGKAAPRSAIQLLSVKLQATLDDFGFEQIKGVVGWNDQICVATDRFLVFYDCEDSYDEAADFKHSGDIALPPEISHFVTIAAGSNNSESLYILSHWIWTLSRKHKLKRWIEAPNVSSISVSEDGRVLLVQNRSTGISILKLYRNGSLLREFVMPREYKNMKICQAEVTGADSIVVSICSPRNNRVLLINEEGIVERMYNSSAPRNLQSTSCITPVHTLCAVPSQFFALGKTGRIFVAETYSSSSKSTCQICKEKILILDKYFEVNQIILPDIRLQFKDYSRICCSGDKLIVTCMKVSYREDANSKESNEVLIPVVNVYKVENESESETEDDSETESETES